MEKFLLSKGLTVLFYLLSLGCFSGCIDPYYSGSGGGYNSPNSGSYGGYGSGYDSSYNDRREREELERERDRLEDERRRLEEERRRNQSTYSPPPPPPPPVARPSEHCPSGFSPSENKCSQEERRRGCKDMRLPGGLGCVKR